MSSNNALVTVPSVLLHDKLAHLIIMDDAGEGTKTLKQLLLDGVLDVPLVQEIGRALGTFLAELHRWGAAEAQSDARLALGDNSVARQISVFATYGRIIQTISSERPDDAQFPDLQNPPLDSVNDPAALSALRDIASVKEKEIEQANDTILMGDFWPGNIVVRLGKDENNKITLERLFVVDWELVKTGRAGMDVGQFCGDLRVLLQFHREKGETVKHLIDAFLSSYTQALGENWDGYSAWAGVAASHMGAHAIAWGARLQYASRTRELTRSLVEEGIQCFLDGYEHGQSWSANRLSALFS
jgi:hypothetical protein